MIYGYARTSTDHQNLAAQIAQLEVAGCEKVFREQASGAKRDRAQLARLLAKLEPGDVVLVTRLDRLARSTLDLLTTLDAVTKAGAAFKSLAESWADTTTPQGRLMVTVLGGFAEFERQLIRTRCSEGFARARANGVKVGRKPSLTLYQRQEALRRKEAGESTRSIAHLFNVHHTTISRLAPVANG